MKHRKRAPAVGCCTVMAFRCIRRLAGALTVGFLLLACPASLQAQDNNPLHAVDTAKSASDIAVIPHTHGGD